VQIADCSEVWPEPSDVWRRGYSMLILASTYLLPLSVLSITYGLVIGKLWRRRAPGNADTARDTHQLKSKRRVSVIASRRCPASAGVRTRYSEAYTNAAEFLQLILEIFIIFRSCCTLSPPLPSALKQTDIRTRFFRRIW